MILVASSPTVCVNRITVERLESWNFPKLPTGFQNHRRHRGHGEPNSNGLNPKLSKRSRVNVESLREAWRRDFLQWCDGASGRLRCEVDVPP